MRRLMIILEAIALLAVWALASKYSAGDFANGYHRHAGEKQ
jgi:hypothetical protein